MNSEGVLAILIVSLSSLLSVVAFKTAECAKDANSTLKVLAERGCHVIPVANGNWDVDCTKAK